MNRFAAMAAIALGLAWTGAAPAQFTIKLKERGEGEAAFVKRRETTTSKVVVTDATGGVLADQREVKGEILEYKETILARQAGKAPTSVQREYTKAQTRKDETTTDSDLQGKTVDIVKKGEAYHFTYKDGEVVAGEAAILLAKDFSKKSDANAELEKLVLPSGPVKTGETWRIAMAKIVAELAKQGGMELDAAKSTGQGTLAKAYKKDGRQFGEMKFTMELPLTTIGKGKEQLNFKAGAKIVINLTLDTCIDGTAEAGTMKMKMNMTGTATTGEATVVLNVTVDADQTQLDAPKK